MFWRPKDHSDVGDTGIPFIFVLFTDVDLVLNVGAVERFEDGF